MIVLKILGLIILIPFFLQVILAFLLHPHRPLIAFTAAVCAVGSGWLIIIIIISFFATSSLSDENLSKITPSEIEAKKEQIYHDVTIINDDIKSMASSMDESFSSADKVRMDSLISRIQDLHDRKLELANILESVLHKYPKNTQSDVKAFITEMRDGAKQDEESISMLRMMAKDMSN